MSMPTGFIENTPFSLTTSDLLQALNQARYLHERLLVAYYLNAGHGQDYHLLRARESLQEAANAMGYNLVAMPDPDDGEADEYFWTESELAAREYING